MMPTRRFLREEGVTATTWDRESAGVNVRRSEIRNNRLVDPEKLICGHG
jgi:hypothetical protein